MTTPGRTLYDVIGVDPAADEHAIHRAYRVRAMLSHPDRGGDEAAFVELVEAYRVLSDPEQRRAYDTEEGLAGRPWALPEPPRRAARTRPPADPGAHRWVRAVAGGRRPTAVSEERARLGSLAAAEVVWEADDPTRLAPVAGGDAVVVVPDRGIALLDAPTGAVRWRTSTGTAPIAPPVLTDELVVVWVAPSSLLLLGRDDGEVRSRHDVDHLSRAGLAARDDLVVCARVGGRLVALPTSGGRARWHATASTEPALPPLVVGAAGDRSRTVVVIGQDQEVVAVDARRGRSRWRRTLDAPATQAVAVDDGTVWIAGLDGQVVGVHAAEGDVVGELDVGGPAAGLLVDDRAVYVMAADGDGAALHGRPRRDLAGGWQLPLPELGPPPTAAASWLTLVEPEGRLTTIEGHHGVVVHECRLPDLPAPHPIAALPGLPGGDAVVCTDRRGVVRAVRPRWR
ncbi:MAG: PQQ-binding-like beta-propeller repeat protein [Acidimicrobiales bacterium]